MGFLSLGMMLEVFVVSLPTLACPVYVLTGSLAGTPPFEQNLSQGCFTAIPRNSHSTSLESQHTQGWHCSASLP